MSDDMYDAAKDSSKPIEWEATSSVTTTPVLGGITTGTSSTYPYPTTKAPLNVEIKQVKNGYVILNTIAPIGEEVKVLAVFNDFYDLCNWLREYFDEPDPSDEELPF